MNDRASEAPKTAESSSHGHTAPPRDRDHSATHLQHALRRRTCRPTSRTPPPPRSPSAGRSAWASPKSTSKPTARAAAAAQARTRRRRRRCAGGGGEPSRQRHPHGGLRLHHGHRRAEYLLTDRLQLRHARDAAGARRDLRGGGEDLRRAHHRRLLLHHGRLRRVECQPRVAHGHALPDQLHQWHGGRPIHRRQRRVVHGRRRLCLELAAARDDARRRAARRARRNRRQPERRRHAQISELVRSLPGPRIRRRRDGGALPGDVGGHRDARLRRFVVGPPPAGAAACPSRWALSTCAGTLRCGAAARRRSARGTTPLHGTRVLRRAGAPGGRRRQPGAVPLPLRRSRAGRRRRRRRRPGGRCPISQRRTPRWRAWHPSASSPTSRSTRTAAARAGGAAPRDKPCDGEAHVFDFVAALGVPLLPTAAWPPKSSGDGALPAAAFFSVHSLKDPATPQHLQEAEAAGVELLLTDGLLALLPPPLAAALRRSPTVHVLAVGGAPKQPPPPRRRPASAPPATPSSAASASRSRRRRAGSPSTRTLAARGR